MAIVLILAKLGIIVSYGLFIQMIRQFKKECPNTKVELDLLSRLEIFMGIGVGLVGLVCVIDASTYTFSSVLCIISICLTWFQRYRLVLVGDTKVLLGTKTYRKKDIKKISSGMVTLIVDIKGKTKPVKIYVPLTSNRVLKTLVVNNKKK